MFRNHWSAEKINSILAEAISSGETLVVFKDISAAERFRFACYNLRRRTNNETLRNLSFVLTFTTTETGGREPAIQVKLNPDCEFRVEAKEPAKEPASV